MGFNEKVVLHDHTDLVRKVAQVDSSGKLVSVSNDTTVKFWSVKEGRCIETSTSHNDFVQDVAVLHENAVVTVGDDSRTVVAQVSDGTKLASYKFDSSIKTCAALTSTTFTVGDKSGNIYKLLFDSAGNEVKVLTERKEAHEDTIFGSYSHGNTFATASFDNTVKLWTSKLNLMHTFRGHNSWAMCVEYNDTYLVSGAADSTVRVYNIKDFNEVCTIRREVTCGFGRIMCVAISKNSKIVVSGTDDQFISLHALPSGDFIAKYNIHMYIHGMCILESGELAVAGQSPNEIKVLKIDELSNPNFIDDFTGWVRRSLDFRQTPPPKKLSVMEDAFMSVLENPKSLDISFIEKAIQAENIKSAADLFCGHNLVLLAIRSQVLAREDIIRFHGDLWYFQDNLYYPASQLTNESGTMLYPIFHHAQDLGIIKDGHQYRVNHEERLHVENRIEKLEESVMELSRRMSRVEAKVDTLSARAESVEKEVEKTTMNFQNLFSAIKRKEKFMQYAGGAKIALSLIPFVGNALANTTYEATNAALASGLENTLVELGAHEDAVPDDAIRSGVGLGKDLTENAFEQKTNLAHAQVDLSNMAVAYFVVSKSGLGSMDKETQRKIKDSVAKTEFRSIERLRSMLKKSMKDNAKEDVNIRKLDAGESIRTSVSPEVPSDEPKYDPTEGKPTVAPLSNPMRPATLVRGIPETTAISTFREKAAALGSDKLPLDEAWDVLRKSLKTLQVSKQVSDEELDDIFLQISEEDEVSEQSFLEVFEKITAGIPLDADEDSYIKREFAEIFRSKLDKNNGYRKSARVLRKAFENMQKEGKMLDINIMPEKQIYKMFEEWDSDKDGRIDVDEFTNAAIAIVRASQT